MCLGIFRQRATSLSLQTGEQQPRQCVADAADQEIFVGMVLGNHQLESERLNGRKISIDSHTEYLGLLAAINREHTMRRHTMQRLVKVEIIVKLLILLRVVF